MREMGKLSGVEIEPEQQTKLLDASVSMAGVIGGGVPGGTCSSSLFFVVCGLDLAFHTYNSGGFRRGMVTCV
jgi:phosphomevalonate kinase